MNREQIKAMALASGFKLKPQPDGTEDLNPYVYEFAAALTEYMQQQNDYLSALASGQPLYGLEEKIADLMQRNKALREERDQLKAVLQDVNTSDYRFSVEQLSAHDAEVIQRFKKSALETAGLSAGCVQLAAPEEVHRTWVQFADHYIDQLHQQAKEVKS
jgi:regulator of replication initiation timing